MLREIQTMVFAVLIFSEGFSTIYLLCPMHASSRRPTVYITEAFQPSQNITESQSSYMGFLSIQISFYALLCIKKQVFMFHVKCTETWKGSSIGNWRFSKGWTVMTETSVLSRYIQLREYQKDLKFTLHHHLSRFPEFKANFLSFGVNMAWVFI